MIVGAGLSRRTALSGMASALAGGPRASPRAVRQVVQVTVAVDPEGYPTTPWVAAIRDRVGAEDLARISANAKPLSDGERAWAQLMAAVAPAWRRRLPGLNAPFRNLSPPRTVRIVLGNQGGDDAFSVPPEVTAFDLSVLVDAYGTQDPERNRTLALRLLAHEYTHLLAVPYLARIGWSEASVERAPFRRALRTLYNEGLGNLRSIETDERYADADGRLTARSRDILASLQPVMLERLTALRRDPSEEEARRLLRNISEGPFTGKWGALPIALWLAADTGFEPERIARWVDKGPPGMLELAAQHADPAFREGFEALRAG